jgi:hypothetical protein
MKYYLLLVDEFLFGVQFVLMVFSLGALPIFIIAELLIIKPSPVKVVFGLLYTCHFIYTIFSMEKPSKVNQYRHEMRQQNND